MNWHALRLHRLAHRLEGRGMVGAAKLVAAFSRMVTGVDIDPGAELGPGFQIWHGHGLVINRQVVTGRDCLVFQCVTLGVNGNDGAAPVLGDRVTVYAGAKVLGGVTIGDGARVGANAVVLRDVPAGATAVGVPARIV